MEHYKDVTRALWRFKSPAIPFCLFNSLFKQNKLSIKAPAPVSNGFPSQKASNVESVFRSRGKLFLSPTGKFLIDTSSSALSDNETALSKFCEQTTKTKFHDSKIKIQKENGYIFSWRSKAPICADGE